MKRKLYQIIFGLFTMLMTQAVHGQMKKKDAHGNEIASYYIDMTSSLPSTKPMIMDFNDSSLNIRYHDYVGKSKRIEVRLINWKKEIVSSFQLEKEFGLNFFHIPLNTTGLGIIKDQVYTLEMKDELKHSHNVLIRWIVPELPKLTTDIIVNPKFLECDNEFGNVVEFYSNVSGGKAPYTINWYVMNDHRTELLYQPRSEKIDQPGKTASIMVDKSPDYYVLVWTVDACGNEDKQTVHLTCEEGKKKINTLFVSPLDNSNLIPHKSGN